MADQPLLRIEHLKKNFGRNEVIRDVSLRVLPKEVIVVVGPSGTGKSTLLQCINLLIRPTAGRIWLEDREITDPGVNADKVRQYIGMVFQEFNLFNHLTALGNVTIGLRRVLGMKATRAREKGMWELDRVGLAEHHDKYPSQLSGGQKQRVGIARALGMEPGIMLFDEPTSALDPELTGEVLSVMRKLALEGITMLVVSHEMGFARDVASRIIFMENGYVIEEGTSEVFFGHAQSKRTQKFLSTLSQGHPTS